MTRLNGCRGIHRRPSGSRASLQNSRRMLATQGYLPPLRLLRLVGIGARVSLHLLPGVQAITALDAKNRSAIDRLATRRAFFANRCLSQIDFVKQATKDAGIEILNHASIRIRRIRRVRFVDRALRNRTCGRNFEASAAWTLHRFASEFIFDFELLRTRRTRKRNRHNRVPYLNSTTDVTAMPMVCQEFYEYKFCRRNFANSRVRSLA